MPTETVTEPKTETTTRRQRTRADKTQKPAPKTKLTLYVEKKAAKNLGVHAMMSEMDKSAFANKMFLSLTRFVVSDRAKVDDEVNRPEPAGQASVSEQSQN